MTTRSGSAGNPICGLAFCTILCTRRAAPRDGITANFAGLQYIVSDLTSVVQRDDLKLILKIHLRVSSPGTRITYLTSVAGLASTRRSCLWLLCAVLEDYGRCRWRARVDIRRLNGLRASNWTLTLRRHVPWKKP